MDESVETRGAKNYLKMKEEVEKFAVTRYTQTYHPTKINYSTNQKTLRGKI